MASDYVFFVCSTLNSSYGELSPSERFHDTKDSIESIRRHAPIDTRILFVDNSSEPAHPDYVAQLEEYGIDFYRLPHNLFSLVANQQKLKSASEANLMYYAFDILRPEYSDCKRIFKISGRYKLSDSFNIHAYDAPEFDDKYTFCVQQFASTYDNWKTQRRVMRLETGLFTFPPSRINELQSLLPSVAWQCLSSDACIEEALFQHVPHEHIVPLSVAHVEGNKAEGDGYVRY
jgi:hypothetical protein